MNFTERNYFETILKRLQDLDDRLLTISMDEDSAFSSIFDVFTDNYEMKFMFHDGAIPDWVRIRAINTKYGLTVEGKLDEWDGLWKTLRYYGD